MASLFTTLLSPQHSSSVLIIKGPYIRFFLFSSAHYHEVSEVRMPDWTGITDAAQLTSVTKGRPNDYRQLCVHVSTGFSMTLVSVPSCFLFLFVSWVDLRQDGSGEVIYLPLVTQSEPLHDIPW
jgi:hypothetical protein